MILAVRKNDGAVFEHFGCDGLNPICYLRELSGKAFADDEYKYTLVFDNNPKFNEYLEKRV